MQTVNKLDYIYRDLLYKAYQKRNDTIDITDEKYELLYEELPINNDPTPGSDIPSPPDIDIPIPNWDEDDHDYSQDYLTFEALEDGTFSFTINDLYYSINNGASWKSLAAGEQTELIIAGTKVLWKGDSRMNNTGYNNGYRYHNGIGTFSSTCNFNISGNINSLTKYSTIGTQAVYAELFKDCINLIDARNLILPATTLTDSCYWNMFYGCSSLIIAPKLPATTLATECYGGMFNGCTSLITAPELPATTLYNYCYGHMFYGCTSLTTAPELPATTLTDYCYQYMFNGCTNLNYIKMLATNIYAYNCILNWISNISPTGTFIKNSKASFDIGDSGIPAGWEIYDIEVPEEE